MSFILSRRVEISKELEILFGKGFCLMIRQADLIKGDLGLYWQFLING